MRAKKTNSVVLILLLFSFLVLAINSVSADSDIIKISEDNGQIGTFAATFGPGSDIPLISPTEGVNYYFQFSLLPLRCEWTIMDPSWHIIYTIIDEVAPWDSGNPDFPYAANSHVVFTIPAFAAEGSWIAIPTWVLQAEDGGEQRIDEQGWSIPVGPGSIWNNIFIAPIYIFNFKLPALFWCLSIVWIPLIVMGILFVYARSAEGVALILSEARDAGHRARETWRKKKAEKAKQ